jgi:hypothetical protein
MTTTWREPKVNCQHVQVERIIAVIAHQLSSLAQAAKQVLARSTTGSINSFELRWSLINIEDGGELESYTINTYRTNVIFPP